jgi:hypothetical protein
MRELFLKADEVLAYKTELMFAADEAKTLYEANELRRLFNNLTSYESVGITRRSFGIETNALHKSGAHIAANQSLHALGKEEIVRLPGKSAFR